MITDYGVQTDSFVQNEPEKALFRASRGQRLHGQRRTIHQMVRGESELTVVRFAQSCIDKHFQLKREHYRLCVHEGLHKDHPCHHEDRPKRILPVLDQPKQGDRYSASGTDIVCGCTRGSLCIT